MCSYLKRKKKISAEIATVMTDFAPHDQWLIGSDFTNYYFVANDKMKTYLINKNISEEKVFVTGIPLSSKFLQEHDTKNILHEFNLRVNKKNILFFGGGEFGLGKTRTFDIFETFVKNCNDMQIIAIAGKNKKMKEAFKEIITRNNADSYVRILGFTSKIPELMSISDLVVTKPGGMTTTESLASHLPMIIINPIPGQEEKNAQFLENHGAGVWIRKDANPDEIIKTLFSSDEKIKQMQNASKSLAKIHSTQDICQTLLG